VGYTKTRNFQFQRHGLADQRSALKPPRATLHILVMYLCCIPLCICHAPPPASYHNLYYNNRTVWLCIWVTSTKRDAQATKARSAIVRPHSCETHYTITRSMIQSSHNRATGNPDNDSNSSSGSNNSSNPVTRHSAT